MRLVLACAAAIALSGCSTFSSLREAWSWEATRPVGATALPPAEEPELGVRITQLQIQRDGIRSQISAEPDIWARQRLYADLHTVGLELTPLQRRLAGNKPLR